ncbi:MAG: hypothetical protein M3290_09780 [Actinomycetota bacterium]|nr:hypothetical protein [Actinomycetota bacterium]
MRARWAILFGAAAAVWLTLSTTAVAATKKASPSPVASPSGGAAGPVWTYQMSKITILLLVLMVLALGGLYYRLIVKRRRGEI